MVQKVSQATKGTRRWEMEWKEESLELGAPNPGPIASALLGAEGLPRHIAQMLPLREVIEISHHTLLRQGCGVLVFKAGN